MEVASIFGIEAAILLQNLEFWIKKNKANGKHFYDGKFWTYNSVGAWQDLFPYMTKDVIRKRLDLLVEKGLLIRGNYNPDRRDRTCWYTLDFNQLHLVCEPNAIVPEAKSSIYTDNKPTDNKHQDLFVGLPFDGFWLKYDKKKGKSTSEKFWSRLPREIHEKIMKHLDEYTKVEKQFRKDPERYLKNRTWEDEVILSSTQNVYGKTQAKRPDGFVQ